MFAGIQRRGDLLERAFLWLDTAVVSNVQLQRRGVDLYSPVQLLGDLLARLCQRYDLRRVVRQRLHGGDDAGLAAQADHLHPCGDRTSGSLACRVAGSAQLLVVADPDLFGRGALGFQPRALSTARRRPGCTLTPWARANSSSGIAHVLAVRSRQ